jgi:hypothetical protein
MTISMLIGLAASRIGSADPLLSKSLCLHLPSLMYPPETASEIDISPFVQTAALVGLGLLHCSSPNRLIIEYLLTELSSPQSTMNDGSTEETKESIAISAGWSLGMLLLGLGQVKPDNENHLNLDIHDLRIEDRLQQCIDGGSKFQDSHLFLVLHPPPSLLSLSSSLLLSTTALHLHRIPTVPSISLMHPRVLGFWKGIILTPTSLLQGL